MQQEPPREAEVDEQVPGGEAGEGDVVSVEEAAAEEESSEGESKPEREPTAEELVAEWKERAIRAAADLDNYRKRMTREKSEALRYSNQALLEELLPVLDNFEMGLQAAAAEKESMIFRGMEMVKKQLDEFPEQAGCGRGPG